MKLQETNHYKGFTHSHTLPLASANAVSDAFLKLSQPETGDVLTHLKLQKLLYYTQGFHLALYGCPLFEEAIYAWEHGPVIQQVYHRFKHLGSSSLPPPENYHSTDILDPKQLELIIDVNTVYGQFSAWKLRDMTHNEQPWLATPRNTEISHLLMQDYFKNQLLESDE
ncbi:MAG: SocA family protein [Bacteroidetes bacterium]|nr:SocA family protein [Bacteroidota bacterium]